MKYIKQDIAKLIMIMMHRGKPPSERYINLKFNE